MSLYSTLTEVLTPYANKINLHGGEIENLNTAVDSLNGSLDDVKADLIANDVIRQRHNVVSVIRSGTIGKDGKFISGSTDGSAYIFNVPEGTTIDYSGGSVYGLFATLPVKNETIAIDGTRHTVASAKIIMPTGANYLVIRASSEPSVLSTNETISEKFNGVTADLDAIDMTVSDLLETGIEFTENGFINDNGAFIENANYKSTDFVNCAVGGTFIPYKYRLLMFANTKIAYYDSTKSLISVISPSASQTLEYVEGVVPYVDGATYVRFCTGKKAVGYYVKYATIKNYCAVVNEEPTNPCDYIGDEISVFNKILCIGDSLTSGTFNYREDRSTAHYINDTKYSYPAYLKKLTGCEIINMGNGGLSSAEWFNAHQNDDLSGFDCAIIQLGVNDSIRYTTWGETSETAFTNIINKLKTENKNIKIFVANIIPATSYSSEQYIAFSSALLAWVTSTYASDANVVPLDMQQYGHTKDSPAYNCGHLSALGYHRLAQDYKGYIGWYINQNKNVFKEVQFIGTDYYYDPI